MNKKGTIEIIEIIGVIAVLAIGFFLMYVSFQKMGEGIEPKVSDVPEASKAINETIDATETFDTLVVTGIVGIFIAALILATIVPASPLLMGISIIITAFGVIVAVPISNAYTEIIQTTTLAAYAGGFPMTEFIMSELPVFIAVFGATLIIAMYGKYSIQRGGQY